MGRKSKLKQDRRAAKIKNNNQESASASASSMTTTSAIGAAAAATITVNADNINNAASTLVVDDEFPRSDCFLRAAELHKGDETKKCDVMTIVDKWLLGATEYGCIHSMYFLGMFHCSPRLIETSIQLPRVGVPFLLEGSILGSIKCATKLGEVYSQAKPYPPKAIIKYWMKMSTKYVEWSNSSDVDARVGCIKKLTDFINRECVICRKTDTVTLTLRQCMGCSTYCYCSEICQAKHWEEHNHRNECKQVKILNKYHKPYAKEIREAVIQGEVSHPALEKLRSKLGLTRPTEEYKELNEGKPIINPFDYFVARNDGTVWIGSAPTPSPIRPPFDTTTTSTTASAKDDQLY